MLNARVFEVHISKHMPDARIRLNIHNPLNPESICLQVFVCRECDVET